MDLHIEFGLASKYQARELYRRFYCPDTAVIADASKILEQDELEEFSEKEPLVQVDETSSETFQSWMEVSQKSHSPLKKAQESACPGPQANAPLLPPSRLDKLATMFSGMLPEKEFSMASLQGYLMMYKTEPAKAIRDFIAWTEQERKEKLKLVRVEKGAVIEEVRVETKETVNSVNV
jgi:chaperone BCS1